MISNLLSRIKLPLTEVPECVKTEPWGYVSITPRRFEDQCIPITREEYAELLIGDNISPTSAMVIYVKNKRRNVTWSLLTPVATYEAQLGFLPAITS